MDHEIRMIEKYYIENDSKDLLRRIGTMGPKDLHEIFKKSYLPVVKSKEEILQNIKYKKSWKNAGLGNKELNPINALKGEVLSSWEQSRVTMPLRSYERYPVNEAFKFRLKGENFGYDYSSDNLSDQYLKFLKMHNEKFKDFIQRPSKYTKSEKFLPSLLQDRPTFYVKHADEITFPKHNTFILENKYRSKKQ